MERLFGYSVATIPSVMVAIALAVCAVLAIAKKQKLGVKASTFAAVGLGLLALSRLFGVVYLLGLPSLMDLDEPMIVIGVLGLASSLISTVGLGLTVAAIFVRRPTPAPQAAPYAY